MKPVTKLAMYLRQLEEIAFKNGESGLAICLSKPLMRLTTLPLLMSMLLYHTDAETIEYERTREFAIGMDSLVKSIENEKLDQDEREKVRDLQARIESIKDQVRPLTLGNSSRRLY
jgi:hypothetical protein